MKSCAKGPEPMGWKKFAEKKTPLTKGVFYF